MGTRFAFDIGTNSIGWAVFDIDHGNDGWRLRDLRAAGVRIFSDGRNPKDGSSLAEMRRIPRGMRRRRDRFLQRQTYLTSLLRELGCAPADATESHGDVNVWLLRERALQAPLSRGDLGRVFLHLNRRRGFKSNRRADRGKNEEESGKISEGAARLRAALAETGAPTIGAFLARRQSASRVRDRQSVRTRLDGTGAKALYDFYPTRDLIENEFDLIWRSQARFHAFMDEETRTTLRAAIFYQRELRPAIVGTCTFIPGEPRLPKATPLAQHLRIQQDLAHIRVAEAPSLPERRLTLAERDLLAEELIGGRDLKYRTQVRKMLGLRADARINLEAGGEDDLKGAATTALLAGTARKPGPFHDVWHLMPLERRSAIVDLLLASDDSADLADTLVRDWARTPEQARAAVQLRLPPGHIRLGRTAALAILRELEAGEIGPDGAPVTVTYARACERAGFHHSLRGGDGSMNRLPYYGAAVPDAMMPAPAGSSDPNVQRYGKIGNPTVHIGLNQLRRITNKLIDLHGKPDQVVIELARDLKQSKAERDKDQRQKKSNEKANAARDAILAHLCIEPNGANRGRLKLWEELSPDPLQRTCPFSGRPISLSQLFTDEVEIEHILPYSRTLDDSPANRTVCFRDMNRFKRGKTPAEAAAAFPDRFDFEEMAARASRMPANKAWRFGPDAMDRWERTERDFLARQLNDTRHLARVARSYLTCVCPDVYVVTGQMTALLRGKWGLNSVLGSSGRKDRNDHRHHALDAAVIGATDRRLLQAIARAASEREAAHLDRVIADLPAPFEGFRQRVEAVVTKVIVSHKMEHGTIASERKPGDNSTTGALHEETAYGLVRDNDANRRRGDLALGNVVRRKPVADLTFKEIGLVRDLALRGELEVVAASAMGDRKALAGALAAWAAAQTPPVRSVRLLKREGAIVTIASRQNGEPYKALVPAENHAMDILELPDGSWTWQAADSFEVNQPDWQPRWRMTNPEARHVMRLHKGDSVQLREPGGRVSIKVVKRLRAVAGEVMLAAHSDAGALADRHDDPEDAFRWDWGRISSLRERRARRVVVDEVGRVKPAPGPDSMR